VKTKQIKKGKERKGKRMENIGQKKEPQNFREIRAKKEVK
jgi:hypothetical protein